MMMTLRWVSSRVTLFDFSERCWRGRRRKRNLTFNDMRYRGFKTFFNGDHMRMKRIRYLLTVDILFSRLVRTTSYKDYFFSELLSKVLSIPIPVKFTPEPLLIEIISGCFVLSVAFLLESIGTELDVTNFLSSEILLVLHLLLFEMLVIVLNYFWRTTKP